MLTPQTLSRLPAPLVDLVNELQTEIIQSIAKKLTKANYLTPSAEWQLYKAAQLRMSTDEVNKLLRKYTKLSKREIAALYTEACKQAINNDAKIYRYYGKNAESFMRSVAFSNSLKAGIKNANGMYENLTRSMVQSSRKTVTHLMDKAYLKVLSGAFSPQEAIYSAVKELADKGIQSVTYPSGRTDWADVAVRRAVITGIGQTTGRMQLDLAEDMGTDLVEVTAHSGARPSHAEWQGKVYSISGRSRKYPPLSVTGYGRGDGLKGWNCRHDFFPFFEGLSERANFPVDKEENLREYELEQKQRGMERAIRKSKRGLAALDSSINSTDDPELKAKLQSDFDRKSNTLKRQEARLSDFCESNGLLPRNDRTRVVGFGRSVSQKAVHGSKRYTAKKADASPKPKPIKTSNSKADTEVVKGGRKDTINSLVSSETPSLKRIDVKAEYEKNATPGKGSITREKGYPLKDHDEEIAFSEWLFEKLGGNIHLISDVKKGEKVKNPDYLWNGKLWDLKTVTTEKAANSAIHKAHKQIATNPGGVILNYGENEFSYDLLLDTIKKRMQWYDSESFDIMIVSKGEIISILRYKK